MEASKDITDKALEALEVAKNSGKIKKGINEVTKAMEKNTAKLVLFAKDVNPAEVIMHLDPLAKEKKIPAITVASKEELGNAAGLKRPTTAVAIVQEGGAKDLIEEIASKLK